MNRRSIKLPACGTSFIGTPTTGPHAWLVAILLFAVAGSNVEMLRARDYDPTAFRGGKVEWARLVGASQWNRHVEADEQLLDFLHEHTSLNIVRHWNSANPDRLDELCQHPFIFSTRLYGFSAAQLGNLAEYLRRGGFLLLDACGNRSVNPSLPDFLKEHRALLESEFSDLRVVALPPDHAVFSIYFKIRERPPQARQSLAEPAYPLYAFYSGDRLLGMISINSLQCGWAGFGRVARTREFMEMATNIYVYAMTRP